MQKRSVNAYTAVTKHTTKLVSLLLFFFSLSLTQHDSVVAPPLLTARTTQ